MGKIIFSIIAVLSGFCLLVDGQTVTNIHPHLVECYQNATLFDRQNRLPMTMPMFIELVRTIEQYPGFSMNMQELALSLIQMFRLDGILRNPSAGNVEGVVPFGLSGFQINKYNILSRYLIPRSNHLFPNASLTSVQKCSLHFMLSNSIETEERGDESKVCNVISGNRKKRQTGDIPEVSNESKTDVQDSFTVSAVKASSVSLTVSTSASEESSIVPTTKNPSISPTQNLPVNLNTSTDSNLPSQELEPKIADAVEFVSPVIPKELQRNVLEKKGDMQMNADGDRGFMSERQTSNTPKSACPVENGVVLTKWGTVSLGTVLAGLATGLEQQNVSIKDMWSDFDNTNNSRVNNQWASTLAGDLAEIIVRKGPTNTMKVGSSGQWNSTQFPKWYFISSSEAVEMTDAEIRGGIDGLIMSNFIQSWRQRAGDSLRLSNVLERYYSTRGVFAPLYQACKRQDLYTAVTPTTTMREQTFNFATVLRALTPNSVIIQSETVTRFTDNAIGLLNAYVPSGIRNTCSSNITDIYVEPHVDMHVIIDCAWNYEHISGILTQLRSELGVPGFSNFTVYSGSNFLNLMNSTNATMNMTDYSQCQGGMNLRRLLEQDLRTYFRNDLEFERSQSFSSSYAKIVLFIPFTGFTVSSTDLEAARNAVNDYRTRLPDVTFLYLTSTSAETLQSLVDDRTTDIFTYTDVTNVNVDNLNTRIRNAPRRITNPACGPDSSQASYSTLQYSQYVPYQGVNYYRVHPRYLFPISEASIKFRADYGSLRICHSRRTRQPNNATTTDGIQCLTASAPSEATINLNEACGGYEYVLQCPPLYISVQSTDTDSTFQCQDQINCRSVDDVKFTVTHSGLTCGVGNLLANPFTLALGIVLMTLKSFFNSNS